MLLVKVPLAALSVFSALR
jgi:Sulfotransferase domain